MLHTNKATHTAEALCSDLCKHQNLWTHVLKKSLFRSGSYLKSLPWRFPFSGSPGSGQEFDACLTPPSFTTHRTTTHHRTQSHQNLLPSVFVGFNEYGFFQFVLIVFSCQLLLGFPFLNNYYFSNQAPLMMECSFRWLSLFSPRVSYLWCWSFTSPYSLHLELGQVDHLVMNRNPVSWVHFRMYITSPTCKLTLELQ